MDAIMNTTMMHAERINRVEESLYLVRSQVQVLETTSSVNINSKKNLISLIVSVGALASGIAGIAKSFGFI